GQVEIWGKKGYQGVETVSRNPIAGAKREKFCQKDDCRHLAIALGAAAGLERPVTIHNFYVPAGGDIPDPAVNEKFEHKLAFLDELATHAVTADAPAGARSVLVGGLNVAPPEPSVRSHKQLINVVSHTPVEVEKFAAFQQAGGWVDVMRAFVPVSEKLYTWWSYRALDWAASDRGRRLDHIWASPALKGAAREMSVIRD